MTHEQLAKAIHDELRAVLSDLYSFHLARNLHWDDVLDAVHGATDHLTDGIEIKG